MQRNVEATTRKRPGIAAHTRTLSIWEPEEGRFMSLCRGIILLYAVICIALVG